MYPNLVRTLVTLHRGPQQLPTGPWGTGFQDSLAKVLPR